MDGAELRFRTLNFPDMAFGQPDMWLAGSGSNDFAYVGHVPLTRFNQRFQYGLKTDGEAIANLCPNIA